MKEDVFSLFTTFFITFLKNLVLLFFARSIFKINPKHTITTNWGTVLYSSLIGLVFAQIQTEYLIWRINRITRKESEGR